MSTKRKRGSLAAPAARGPRRGAPACRAPGQPPPPAEAQTPVQQTPEVQTPEVAGSGGAAQPTSAAGRRHPRVTATAQAPGLPKYLRLERKELLIWPDQITSLSILARVLNRNRGGAGERITHEHADPRRRSPPAEPVPGSGGHDRGRAPPVAGTPGLTDSGPPESVACLPVPPRYDAAMQMTLRLKRELGRPEARPVRDARRARRPPRPARRPGGRRPRRARRARRTANLEP